MTVEMQVATQLLPKFEALAHLIPGKEVGRRPMPWTDGEVTIVEMDMEDAPPDARTMEVVMTQTRHETVVDEIRYFDKHGTFLNG